MIVVSTTIARYPEPGPRVRVLVELPPPERVGTALRWDRMPAPLLSSCPSPLSRCRSAARPHVPRTCRGVGFSPMLGPPSKSLLGPKTHWSGLPSGSHWVRLGGVRRYRRPKAGFGPYGPAAERRENRDRRGSVMAETDTTGAQTQRFVDTMSGSDALLWTIGADPVMRPTIVALMVLDQAPDWFDVRDRIADLTRTVPRLRSRASAGPRAGADLSSCPTTASTSACTYGESACPNTGPCATSSTWPRPWPRAGSTTPSPCGKPSSSRASAAAAPPSWSRCTTH